MSFQKIVEAAITQNLELLQRTLNTNTIDAWKKGSYFFSAVSQCALEKKWEAVEFLLSRGAGIKYAVRGAAVGGHKDYVEALLSRGADINHAVYGAAIGGHKDYVETLLSRGANIKYAINGAANGGHKDYVEALLSRGANINHAVRGAAIGGHEDYAEALLSRGANINHAVRGAAIGGHKDYVEALLSRGANINFAVRGAAIGRHISSNTKNHMAWLSFYQPQTIGALTQALNKLDNPIFIDKITENRAIAVSKHMHLGKIGYPESLTRTDPQCQGMLYLLMTLVMKASSQLPNKMPSIPFELWRHIFSYITPTPLGKNSLEHLGFITARAYLRAQLSTYDSGWGYHKQRARSFFKAVSELKSKEALQDLVSKQTKVLQGNNPYKLLERDCKHKFNVINTTIDRYHGIIGFWNEMQTEKNENNFNEAEWHLI